MFTDCEKWRKDFGVDEIARTFKFDENPMVTVYYPRYYHKTDKVLSLIVWCLILGWPTRLYRTVGED